MSPSLRSSWAGRPSCKIIPGRLVWAPQQQSPRGCHSAAALDFCRHGASRRSSVGSYEVRYYGSDMCGRAFGPLGLESLLRFCRGLEAELQGRRPGSGALALSTPEGDEAYRANAAVLLGAYLILRHGWSAARVAGCLGQRDSGAVFARSWARQDDATEDPVLQVRDCWAGVELARRHSWIDPGFIRSDFETDAACARYNEQLNTYDAAWIIPGRLMVGADPTTVVFDPNPATCKQLLPGGGGDKRGDADERSFTRSTEYTSSKSEEIWVSDHPSCHTVCKGYSPRSNFTEDTLRMVKEEQEEDFVSFFRCSGIRLIVRANFDDEEGMPPAGGYGDNAFEPYGIAQANIRMADRKGAVPRPSDIRRALQAGEDYMQHKGTDAVMVHCKGGFGRSVMLACCLAISRWDVGGLALLGWVRIVRPGAVTTRLQELFLAQLKGRRDLYRDALLPVPMEEEVEEARSSDMKLSCGSTCRVQ